MEQQAKFEVGKTYKGVSGAGTCAVTVVSRTEKSVVVDTVLDKGKRCMISKYSNEREEVIYYRSWMTGAGDEYSEKEQRQDDWYEAYHR